MIKADMVLDVGGRSWKVREAESMGAALQAIASARVSGCIGYEIMRNETHMGGGIHTVAHVVRVNSDGSEAVAYQTAY